MSGIIDILTSRLDVSAEEATGGAGAIMNLIKEKAPAGDFQDLVAAVPEANDWMAKAPAASGGGGGGLLGAATGLLGGAGGGLGGVISMLSKTGMSTSTATKFVPMLMELVKEKAGESVMSKLAASVPMLKDLMGGGGGGLAGQLGGLFGKR